MICNFFFQYLHRCLISENAASPSVWIGRLRCALNRYRRTPNDRNFFLLPYVSPKKQLSATATPPSKETYGALSRYRCSHPSRTPPGQIETAAFIWKIHKSHKRVFSNICFLPSGSVTVNFVGRSFFQTVKGNYCVTLVYPALFYSAAFSIVTRTLHDRTPASNPIPALTINLRLFPFEICPTSAEITFFGDNTDVLSSDLSEVLIPARNHCSTL